MQVEDSIAIKVPDEAPAESITQRAWQLFQGQLQSNRRHTDRMFGWLMAVQWVAGIIAAVWVSPQAWEGIYRQTHIHVWAAIFLGGVISGLPIYLTWRQPGAVFTRHVVAISQMLTSALLIHLTGGRIETHFHVFGSLAFLAFYQDWKVLLSATVVVALDHAVRGIFWPQSVFGVLTISPWRWIEHALWVLFEVVFLVLSIRQSLRSMYGVAERQAQLEGVNEVIERKVTERTEELRHEIVQRKRAEQHLSLEYAVSCVVAESISNPRGAEKVLQVIGQSLQQDVGLLWMVDHRDGALRCAEGWRSEEGGAEEFCVASRQMTFLKGVGLAGRVWASGEPTFIADVTADENCPRATVARRLGLRGAFAFPVVGANGISGVIEFLGRKSGQPDAGLLRTCSVIGGQLGRSFEHKRVQDHLFQSQKMETVGKMAGGIAHEFNSILTAVIGQAEVLLGELPPGSALCHSASEIGKAAGRAAELTRQLLAYGRKQMLRPEVLDLNEVLGGMAQTLTHLAGRETDLRIVPCHGLKSIKADAGQIEQVIVNIVMNSVDAMPSGGRLTLETANVSLESDYVSRIADLKPGRYVMLAVSDTGTGMSEDVRARVFDPFFTTKDVGKGTGLGLPTCQGIVKQSGGHIAIYSEPGRGTTVKIYLPEAAEKLTPAAPEPRPADLPHGTETILMVEDDPALRDMAGSLLGRLGYKVLVAENGVEALKSASLRESGHIDLLFTDVVMPHMSGQELSERVRRLFPRTKILFTSAYAENAIAHQGVLDPDITMLSKPFAPSALARKVRDILDQPEPPKANALLTTFSGAKITN